MSMSSEKPAPVSLIDLMISLVICCALTIFVFWIATRFSRVNIFEQLPDWIIGSYGFFTALGTGTLGLGAAVIESIRRPDPKPNYVKLVLACEAFIIALIILVVILNRLFEPAPPSPKVVRVTIEADAVEVGSGGHYDGGRNPGCQSRSAESCVRPKHGGVIVPGSGKPRIISQSGRSGFRDPKESPQEFCVTIWASTGACETPVYLKGAATAVEEYTPE